MPLTYGEYLRVEELLALQSPRSDGPEHDETLFIVIHQVYELWFKQVLHELDYLGARLGQNELPPALQTFKRVLSILKVLVTQLDILETMTPLEFLSFRERLESGSGFQSAQFRELEFFLGHKRSGPLESFAAGSPERQRLERRYTEPTLWDAFLHCLASRGYALPAALLSRDVRRTIEPSPELRKVLVSIYRNDPLVASLCERFVDLDEGLQEWRYRHVKMVQRTIGGSIGTGGSSGADYLKSTLFAPLFADLWAIRSEF